MGIEPERRVEGQTGPPGEADDRYANADVCNEPGIANEVFADSPEGGEDQYQVEVFFDGE